MKLDEEDYLTYQLYTASKSKQVRRNRRYSWGITVLAFIGLAYLGHVNENSELTIYFAVLSVISLLIYPFYSSWRYKRIYRKHIRENLKGRFQHDCTIEFGKDSITTRDKTGETKINVSEIDTINEIKDYYFIKLSNGTSLIIAKNKVENPKAVVEYIQFLSRGGVHHNIELSWKWH